ncbi:MAG: hypothetical protein R2856_37675 [Caldilineaceae bacterium]
MMGIRSTRCRFDHGPNPVNCAALDDSVVWVLTRSSIDEVCRVHPDLRETLIANVTQTLPPVDQADLSTFFLSVSGRLAAFILAQSNGQPALARVERRRTTPRQQPCEVVSRSLSELQRLDFIEADARRIRISIARAFEDLIRRSSF